MANSIRFDAGAGGNSLATKSAPVVTGDFTIYLSFKVSGLPGEFTERGLWALGSNIRIFTYFSAVLFHANGSEFTYFDTGTVTGWVHVAIIKSGSTITFKMVQQGFDSSAPSYLFNGTITPAFPVSPALVYFNCFDNFGSPGNAGTGTNLFGHYLEYIGVAHTSTEVLAQLQSRDSVHSGVTTKYLFDATGVAGASVGQDASGNGNHATRVNADGFVAVADEPSDWAGPPPPADVVVTLTETAAVAITAGRFDFFISPLVLPPNQWVQIQPPPAAGVYTQGACLDPTNPLRHFVCWSHATTVDPAAGIWRTENGGLTYQQMSGSLIGGPTMPVDICMPDPANPNILFVADGVWGGPTSGCWRSLDGGETWARPGNFDSVAPSGDGYHVSADPSNPLHVIFSSHSPWAGQTAPGFVETLDGGTTWTARNCAGVTSDGGVNIDFVTSTILLYHSQQTGLWRSTDGGTTWALVSSITMDHGGGQITREASGILYISGVEDLRRSADLGATWQAIGPVEPATYFMSCASDGNYIYTGWHGFHRVQRRPLPIDAADSWETIATDQPEFEGPSFRILYEPKLKRLYHFAADAGVWVGQFSTATSPNPRRQAKALMASLDAHTLEAFADLVEAVLSARYRVKTLAAANTAVAALP